MCYADNAISVVIPVYNEAKSIEGVIKDLYNKVISKIANAELLVIEDGSFDGTKEILKKLQSDVPFRLISEKKERDMQKLLRER
jgi:dolichol-phosphate mannosyltransferase